MQSIFNLTAKDPIIATLRFRPYQNAQERRAYQFLPTPQEQQELEIQTPWGETLSASYGDFIVSEFDNPQDHWPVAKDIFEKTYMELRPGYYVKRPLNRLVPLVEVTKNPEQNVAVHTLEGVVTVKAGDFYLARGVRGEIWPIPAQKVKDTMYLVEDYQTETLYATEYFSIERDDNGEIFARLDDEVLVVPVSENGEVILLSENSPAFGVPVLILSGGGIENGEKMSETANRELQEELGIKAGSLTYLGELLPFSKYLNIRSQIYLAEDLVASSLPGDEDRFDNCPVPVQLDAFESLIQEGRLQDARTIAALFLARTHIATRIKA
jgi:8-oxo-dGTP pyrophosphatase MutT (NUDIX family)